MEALTKHISERLLAKPYCTVFENDLVRVFPPVRDRQAELRYAEIKAYAEARGWEVKISDPGIRATFRKIK